jgi:hypothetical protein
MLYEPIIPGSLISESQAAVVQSCFPLLRTTQRDWALAEGLDPAQLSKMLNGRWIVRDDYATRLHALVMSIHPVQLAA